MARSARGSVLMEFVIVLPVYFILIGFAFVVGELALHSIRLSSSADRGMALSYKTEDITASGFSLPDKEDFFWELKKALSLNGEVKEFAYEYQADDDKYSYEGSDVEGGSADVSQFGGREHLDVVPNDGIDGHFTKAVAGGMKDDYALSPLARGFAAFWVHEIEHRVYDGDLMSDALDRPDEDSMDVMLKKGHLGRAEMFGNYRYDSEGQKVREYGHYAIQRNLASYWRPGDANRPYRGWDAGALNGPDGSGEEAWKHAKYPGDWNPGSESYATVKSGSDDFMKSSNPGQRPNKGAGSGDSAYSYHFMGVL